MTIDHNINLKISFDWPAGMSRWASVADLQAMEARLMSALSDKIASIGTTVDAATARVQTDVSGLKAQIVTLQSTVDSGGASPADLAALDALQAKVDAIDPTSPVVLPTDPSTAAPAAA